MPALIDKVLKLSAEVVSTVTLLLDETLVDRPIVAKVDLLITSKSKPAPTPTLLGAIVSEPAKLVNVIASVAVIVIDWLLAPVMAGF